MIERFRSEVVAPIALTGFFVGASKVASHYESKMQEASERVQLQTAHEHELRSAYEQKFPTDTNITAADLERFEGLAVGSGEFPALDATYEALRAADPGALEIMLGGGEFFGTAAAIIAGAIAAFSTVRYGYNKIAGN